MGVSLVSSLDLCPSGDTGVCASFRHQKQQIGASLPAEEVASVLTAVWQHVISAHPSSPNLCSRTSDLLLHKSLPEPVLAVLVSCVHSLELVSNPRSLASLGLKLFCTLGCLLFFKSLRGRGSRGESWISVD